MVSEVSNMNVLSLTPMTSPMKFDVMVGDRYRCTVRLELTPWQEYDMTELKAFVRMQRPSLEMVDFDLVPCGRPQFRN